MIKIDAKWVGDIATGKYKEIIHREFDRTMYMVVLETERQAVLTAQEKKLRGVTGQLITGIKGRKISAVYGRIGVEGPASVYAEVMEKGRRPGSRMPPVDALIRWVVLKLRVPAKKARSAAFLIARKIHKQGIKGRRYFKETEIKIEPKIQNLYVNLRDRIAKLLSD